MPLTQVQGGMLAGSTNTTTTIQSNGTTAITIDSSQNVGIGTSNPLASPKVTISNNSTVTAGGDGGGNGLCVVGTTGTGAGAQLVVVGSDTAAIDKGGAITFGGKFNTGNNDFAQWARVAGYKENGTNTDFSGYLGFYTRPNNQGIFERMRVTSGGGVRIACENFANQPSSTNWGIELNNTSASSVFFGQGTGTETQINFGNRNGIRGSIQTNATNTIYNTTSDYRLKENVEPMTGALAKVAQLKPSVYKWKVNGADGQGFIAHELQAVVPDCVTGEKDAVDENGEPKYQMVDTSFLVATLTAAIQELKAELDATKAEVAALKAAP